MTCSELVTRLLLYVQLQRVNKGTAVKGPVAMDTNGCLATGEAGQNWCSTYRCCCNLCQALESNTQFPRALWDLEQNRDISWPSRMTFKWPWGQEGTGEKYQSWFLFQSCFGKEEKVKNIKRGLEICAIYSLENQKNIFQRCYPRLFCTKRNKHTHTHKRSYIINFLEISNLNKAALFADYSLGREHSLVEYFLWYMMQNIYALRNVQAFLMGYKIISKVLQETS